MSGKKILGIALLAWGGYQTFQDFSSNVGPSIWDVAFLAGGAYFLLA
jgi:hypothetical protein